VTTDDAETVMPVSPQQMGVDSNVPSAAAIERDEGVVD
jgi:hypothetical protein